MPQIKTSLKQLFGLFVQSAQDPSLDMPSRQLAARATVLVAHLQRIEAKIDACVGAGTNLEKKVDSSVAELAEHILRIDQRTGGAAPSPAATTDASGEGGGPMSEEETADEMAARVLAETEAEAAAIRSGKIPPAPPVPTPAPTDNGAAVTPIRQQTPPGGAA